MIDAGPWLDRWRLTPDGEPIVTPSSRLWPVRTVTGHRAMLKLATGPEERAGAHLMAWWVGEGAARVLAQEDEALLLERATGPSSLAAMAAAGEDDVASRILCVAIGRLHGPRLATSATPPKLVPLDRWFASLFPAAALHGGLLDRCACVARYLLDEPRDEVVLHGDVHHGNVLDFGDRGWLAIDPKGLIGERGFDYANLFCNPTREIAVAPGRMRRQVEIVSAAAGLEPVRLLKWILAWSGLSAVWMIEDGERAAIDLSICEIAAAELDQAST